MYKREKCCKHFYAYITMIKTAQSAIYFFTLRPVALTFMTNETILNTYTRC